MQLHAEEAVSAHSQPQKNFQSIKDNKNAPFDISSVETQKI
jgi:hypothetical protein